MAGGRHPVVAIAACAAAIPAAVAHGQAAPSPFPADYRLGAITLPDPGGRHPIGTRRFELARADGTPLGVIAWYPAARAGGERAPYFTAAERAVTGTGMARTFRWPNAMLAPLGELRTNAYRDAPVARGRHPLVIFSHGYLMFPQQSSALMERLAAAGYVVLSVAHPYDASDLPSSRGTLATRFGEIAPDPDPKASEAVWAAPDRAAQRNLLPALHRAPRFRYMTGRQAIWRDDLAIVADAFLAATPPAALRPIAAAVQPGRLAYAGMSFGGSTSVSACERDARCRAAINLDGMEFDPTLYDRDVTKPLLLLQSDWRAFPNAGPAGRDFSIYDQAYERHATAGGHRNVHRYRLNGIKHLGMSDLVLAPRDAHRDALVGPIDGARATAAVNAISLAFLDRYLTGKRVSLSSVAARHPELAAHSAGPAKE